MAPRPLHLPAANYSQHLVQGGIPSALNTPSILGQDVREGVGHLRGSQVGDSCLEALGVPLGPFLDLPDCEKPDWRVSTFTEVRG